MRYAEERLAWQDSPLVPLEKEDFQPAMLECYNPAASPTPFVGLQNVSRVYKCLGCEGSEKLPKYVGITQNDDIRIPMKQPEFNGKYDVCFFFCVAQVKVAKLTSSSSSSSSSSS